MRRLVGVVTCGLGFALLASAGGKCRDDIPISWELRVTGPAGVTSAITGDGIYIDGVGGVDRAVINLCSGTGDATLLLANSRRGPNRSIHVSFSQPLAVNSDTPSWAATTVSGNWFLNIRNIWFVPDGNDHANEYEFTTHLTTSSPNGGHLRMLNPNAQAVPGGSGGVANDPYDNSLVRVQHCPSVDAGSSPPSMGPCMDVAKETWFVRPDPVPAANGAQVASLILDGKHGPINAGEFSIPFYFVITRQ